MAENFIESEIVSDNWVDHINLRVDSDKLTAFQDTLKWTRDNNAMNAFIDKLSTLVELKAKADDLRKKQWNALIIERPNVGWVDIVAAVPVDPEVALHNEKIRAIHQAIKEFNASRTEFLKTFIARYISPPVAQRNDPNPVRSEPRVGTRQLRSERQNSPQFSVSPGTTRWETPEALSQEEIIARMSDAEIDEAIKNFQIQWFQGLYREMATANDKRAALLDMKRRLAANTDNSWVVNQALLAMARWFNEKSKR
jgi:hypothetical protein